MKSATSWLMVLFASGTLAACGEEASGPGGGGGGGGGNPPAAVTVLTGNNQSGKTLEALAQPLVVEVTDAGGAAVAGATVTWTVASGPGSVSTGSSSSNASGQASVTFTPGATLGTSTVRATVTGVSATAEFTITTSTVVVTIQGIAFNAPGGGDAVTVPVGTPVEWVNRDNVQHTATSSAVPAGGAAITSGFLAAGARFSFTPQVAGTWTYFCEVHPGIMTGATITATGP